MAISVKLPVFEGPLDLLMHLIEKNKIDIYDIPISEITDQYLEYVRQMDHENMDVTSEFLVMAATLLDIKSRMLLPREKDPETGEEEGDPREELVQRLLEYKKYKYLSEELAVRREQAGIRFFRAQDLPKEVRNYQPPIDYEELLGNTDLSSLKKIFGEVLRRKKSRRDPIRSGFGKIKREEVSIDSKALYIRAYLQTHPRTDFRALLESQESREEVIVTFLILLELMKNQKVHIFQDSIGGRILVEAAASASSEAPTEEDPAENGSLEDSPVEGDFEEEDAAEEASFEELSQGEGFEETVSPEESSQGEALEETLSPEEPSEEDAFEEKISPEEFSEEPDFEEEVSSEDYSPAGIALSALPRVERTSMLPVRPAAEEDAVFDSDVNGKDTPADNAFAYVEEAPVPEPETKAGSIAPAAMECREDPEPVEITEDLPAASIEDGQTTSGPADYSLHLWRRHVPAYGPFPAAYRTQKPGARTGSDRPRTDSSQPLPCPARWEAARMSRLWARRRRD